MNQRRFTIVVGTHHIAVLNVNKFIGTKSTSAPAGVSGNEYKIEDGALFISHWIIKIICIPIPSIV